MACVRFSLRRPPLAILLTGGFIALGVQNLGVHDFGLGGLGGSLHLVLAVAFVLLYPTQPYVPSSRFQDVYRWRLD